MLMKTRTKDSLLSSEFSLYPEVSRLVIQVTFFSSPPASRWEYRFHLLTARNIVLYSDAYQDVRLERTSCT